MAAAEPDSDYDTDSDSEYDSDDEYDYGDDPDEYKKTRYYLKHRQEYNYGSNLGVNVMSYPGGRFDVSRFGDEERGITAVGPLIEEKIQELLGDEVLKEYNNIIENYCDQKENVFLIDLYSTFKGHGIHARQFWRPFYRKDDPYYWYFSNLEDPNDRGYDAIRRLFLNKIADNRSKLFAIK